MNVFQTSQIIVGATQNITMGAQTKSLEINNMSHLGLDVTGGTQGDIIRLGAFQSKIISVNPSEQITFNIINPAIPASAQNNEYVGIYQSLLQNETGIVPLALIPVYTTQIQGNVTVDQINGSVNATIDGGSVGITGLVDANIQNANIDTNSTVLNKVINHQTLVDFGSQTETYTLAAGATSASADFNQNVIPGYCSGVYVIVNANNDSGWDFEPGNVVNWNVPFDYQGSTFYTLTKMSDNGKTKTYFMQFNNPYLLTGLTWAIKNTGATSITDDWTVHCYGITANDVITNGTSNPGIFQGAVGEFDKAYYFDVTLASSGGTSTLVAASVGGYIKSLVVSSWTNAYSTSGPQGDIAIDNGSGNQVMDLTGQVNGTNTTQTFGTGIPHLGLTATAPTTSGLSGTYSVKGLAIIGQNNAPHVAKTIQ